MSMPRHKQFALQTWPHIRIHCLQNHQVVNHKPVWELCMLCPHEVEAEEHKQKTKPCSKTPGERLFMDISLVQEKSFGGSKYWLLPIDDAMDFCFSKFLKTKDQISTMMILLLRDLKNNKNIMVKKICCDNAGENVAFHQNAKKGGLGLNFKFTAHATSQQNGWVKCKLATLFGRIWLMLNLARMVGTNKDLCKGLWAECTKTVTKIENIAMRNDKESPFCQFFKKDSPLILFLWTFGKVRVVHNAKKICSKLENCGRSACFSVMQKKIMPGTLSKCWT